MKPSTGLALVAAGAVLAFAITAQPSFLNLHVAGIVIMLTGMAGLALPRRPHEWLRRRVVIKRAPYAQGGDSPGGPGGSRKPSALPAGRPPDAAGETGMARGGEKRSAWSGGEAGTAPDPPATRGSGSAVGHRGSPGGGRDGRAGAPTAVLPTAAMAAPGTGGPGGGPGPDGSPPPVEEVVEEFIEE